jgi:hypothetical protein
MFFVSYTVQKKIIFRGQKWKYVYGLKLF